MAKKVEVKVKDQSGNELDSFRSKTLTKLFNKLEQGTEVKISIHENDFGDQFVGNYVIKGLPNEPEEPQICPGGQHWDDSLGKCVDNVVRSDEPTQEGLIYDSDVQGNWNNGQARFVTDREGNVNANGFGFTVNASGEGGFRIDGRGQGNLEPASSGHRRIYICACNYNGRLEGEFSFLDNKPRNFSIKTRNRHQFADEVDSNAPDSKKQGGFGIDISIEEQKVGFKIEVVHGTNTGDKDENLPKNLEVGKWYKFRYSYKDKSSTEVDIKVELDYNDGQGFRTVLKHVAKPPSVFFNKTDFDTWSQFWLRLNDEGKIGTRHIKLFAI